MVVFNVILEEVKASILESGDKIHTIDLDKENFNQIMTGADLLVFRNHEVIDKKYNKFNPFYIPIISN